MTEARDVTPILLAAGASTRMGRPKALLDFDGRTVLDLALDAVRGLGTPVVVLGAAREEIQARVPLGSVQVAYNDDWERGQTSSLKAGLSCLAPAAAAFLFHPVDFPLVSQEEVGRLVEAFLGCKDPRKAIFIPSYGMQRGHPVLCRRELAPEFLALPDDAPARTVINFHPQRIAYVDYDQAYILMDMDTPQDYARCLEAYRERRRRQDR
ncbi:MAG TPA: nucleotidyltransferase family protein [Planctomycetota bacterium]|nr:nucleotidyltransferase family protein [Planctomycetota bacterium]